MINNWFKNIFDFILIEMIRILLINFIDFGDLLNLVNIFDMRLLFTLQLFENIISLKLIMNHLHNCLDIIGDLLSFQSTKNVVHQWKFIAVFYLIYFAEIIHDLFHIGHILEFDFDFLHIVLNALLLTWDVCLLFSVHLKGNNWIVPFILEVNIEDNVFNYVILFRV